MKRSLKSLCLFALTAMTTAACGGADEPLNVTLPFKAMVGDKPFACGQTYTGLGTTGSTFEPKDFRLYLHNVRLLSDDGTEVPVTLTNDGAWQKDGVAMLDFEDKTGLCSNGTQATNDHLVGTVPSGHYQGLRFSVGVPFEMNHVDLSTSSPLNLSTLFWGWEGGYMFVRLDGRTTGLPNGHSFHLGSSECQLSGPNQVTSCDHPNRPDVEIAGIDPTASQAVVLDVAALYSGSNLDTNQAQTASGCMSESEDNDCAPIFQRIGLAFGNAQANPSAQVFFRKE